MKREFEFKKWEVGLMAIAALLFAGSSYLYFSGVSIRHRFLGWQDEADTEPVGKLANADGSIQRQLFNGTDFQNVFSGTPLFNLDTIVTGPDGRATITMNDGGSIDLGPNTMVRLAFESRLSLDGISRSANVQVVAGNVTGQAQKQKIVIKTRDQVIAINKQTKETIRIASAPLVKPTPVATPTPAAKPALISLFNAITGTAPSPTPSPTVQVAAAPSPVAPSPSPSPVLIARASPSPSPSPSLAPPVRIQVKMIAPRLNEVLSAPNGSDKPSVEAQFEWQTEPADLETRLILTKTTQKDPIVEKDFRGEQGKTAYKYKFESPGQYEWELMVTDKRLPVPKRLKSRFQVRPEFEAIELLPPLIGGKEISNNELNGEMLQEFDITLRWKKYRRADDYTILVTERPDSPKPMVQRKTEEVEYRFNRNKVYNRQFYYLVKAQLPSGFVATSKSQVFNFVFLPPKLVVPESGARLSLAGLNGNLLMTWQKTNFTKGYEIQISRDPRFQVVALQKKVSENFLIFTPPGAGTYYWRVKSFSSGVESTFSAARILVLTP